MFWIRNFILYILLLLSFEMIAQEDSLFLAAKKIFLNSPAYECSFEMDLNVDFINIPNKKGQMTYSPKSGVDYKFDGVGFFPKKSANEQMQSILNTACTVIKLEEDVNSVKYKVIPNDINFDLVLADIIIDKESANMVRMNTITKESGAISLSFEYNANVDYLPSKLTIDFDLKNRKLPASFTGDFENMGEDFDMNKQSNAELIIFYANYIIK